jgi:hypothetical protein
MAMTLTLERNLERGLQRKILPGRIERLPRIGVNCAGTSTLQPWRLYLESMMIGMLRPDDRI